jgi:hypothetical protein
MFAPSALLQTMLPLSTGGDNVHLMAHLMAVPVRLAATSGSRDRRSGVRPTWGVSVVRRRCRPRPLPRHRARSRSRSVASLFVRKSSIETNGTGMLPILRSARYPGVCWNGLVTTSRSNAWPSWRSSVSRWSQPSSVALATMRLSRHDSETRSSRSQAVATVAWSTTVGCHALRSRMSSRCCRPFRARSRKAASARSRPTNS